MTEFSPEVDSLCLKMIRGLAIDAVQAANSGHPGMPLGAAAVAHALWTRHLRHSPAHPKWFDRDRFVLSAGHGSMLLYALLFATGYGLTVEDLMAFRQWGSRTPGHPENGLTPGVEMATGPLGQGFGSAVGMAIAERFLSASFNKNGHLVVDHRTYVLASDGDLMEGVTQESASLAGHLRLHKLIVLYDDNRITIDGSTELAMTEITADKFSAMGWRVFSVNGMRVEEVDRALWEAKTARAGDGPALIVCRTEIGHGSPNKANSAKAHGAALGAEEVALTKKELGIPDEPFWVCESALAAYRSAVAIGERHVRDWEGRFADFEADLPADAISLRRAIEGDWSGDWLCEIGAKDAPVATRNASQWALNAAAAEFPTLVGGAADLAESVMTMIHESPVQSWTAPEGRNLAFGVREHAMMAVVNGLTLHGGCRAYGGTFLIFSDYCRASIRLAALMRCPSIFVFSHDSIGLGEDGPTHQPVEHLAGLRAIPNLNVMRPADAHEAAVCWQIALELTETPSVIVTSRQALQIGRAHV